jgi:plasmid stability protein
MGQILIRRIAEETVAALKKRAKANGRSAESEARAILDEAVKAKKHDFWKEAERLRNELAESGRTFSDSTELIRQDRDSR